MKFLFTVVISGGIGFQIGAVWHARAVKRNLNKIRPVLVSVVTDMTRKYVDENLSKEELQQCFDDELKFIFQVLKD